RWFGLSGLVLALLLLAACGGESNTQQTPTTNQFVTLQLGIPAPALNAPITGQVPDSQILHVGITFAIDEATLKQFNQGRTARPGQPTSGEDLAKKIGISDADYQRIKNFFGVSNASLTLSETHTSLNVDIKAGEAAKLLQTKFVYHMLNGRTYYTPDPLHMPQVPQSVAAKILAVTGLDTYSQAPKTGLASAGKQFNPASAKSFGLCPLNVPGFAGRDQVAHTYGFDKLWNRGWTGQQATVNLVEIDGVSQSDLSAYFSCVNYKGKVSFTTIDGKSPVPGGETTLDMDMIAGLAPDVNIHDYQTDLTNTADGGWQNLLDTFQRIIDDHSHNLDSMEVVSVSLGAPEAALTTSLAAAFTQRLQILTQVEHMTVFVASGDCAAFMDGVYGKLDVSFPASDPYAAAVGGTVLQTDLSGQQRNSEIAWSDSSDKQQCNNSWGTGGGLSTFFARPTWQTGVSGIQNKYSTGKRQLPDVAAVASNLLVFFEGIWQPIGGTSAATPIWATAMVILNQGYVATKGYYSYGPDTFYYIQSHATQTHPYYQITQGDNLYYKAGPGWNYATGLGAPYLPDFLGVEQATTS
ncbi:MAG TPA: S53 family peptidase, partial [Ktedonobacteraceae bacterium]